MLVLTRLVDEKIRINDDIVITIIWVKPGKVRLGIDAPKHVRVHREEIYDVIKKEEGGYKK